MRRLAPALVILAVAALGTSGLGCNEAAGDVSRENGPLRVVLNEAGIGSSGSAIWVDVTVENIGTSELLDFHTYLGVDLIDAIRAREEHYNQYDLNKYLLDATYEKYLFETYTSVCDGLSIPAGERSKDIVQVWDVVTMGDLAWGDNPVLVITADDAEGDSYAVAFTIPQKEVTIDWSLS
jgi:hypothetical protein